jgi:hypothetical protein
MSSPEATLVREHAGLGHFDVYRGDPYERAIADQLEFLARHLGV